MSFAGYGLWAMGCAACKIRRRFADLGKDVREADKLSRLGMRQSSNLGVLVCKRDGQRARSHSP